MAHESNDHFDWNTWMTRVFVLVVMVTLGVSLYTIFAIRAEIVDRRYAFCVNENESSRKQRVLWKGVIESSQNNEEKAFVFVGVKKFPVVFERVNNDVQIAAFVKFVNDTYPIGQCERGELVPSEVTP